MSRPARLLLVVVLFAASAAALTPASARSALALSGESTAALKSQLLKTAAGTANGVRADARTKATIAAIADELAARCDGAFPALDGAHDLVYCDSTGPSSGKIGPFVGAVTQEFRDDAAFVNAVAFGPLRISLDADRAPLDGGRRYRVTFRRMALSVFGAEVASMPLDGGGAWTLRYVDDDLRVMAVPSLFVLARREPRPAGLADVLRDPARFMEDDD